MHLAAPARLLPAPGPALLLTLFRGLNACRQLLRLPLLDDVLDLRGGQQRESPHDSLLRAGARGSEADWLSRLRELRLEALEQLLEHLGRPEPAANHLGRAEVGLL